MSNYATKSDWKGATDIDTSETTIAKSETTLIDLSILSNVVKIMFLKSP